MPSLDILIKRARMLKDIRVFFDSRDFIEVETPIRIASPAPECHIDCPPVSSGGFLRASPELQMKKLLASGMEKIYQIGACFRDGERGSRHNPEFTMIEWYRLNATYRDIENDLRTLMKSLASSFSLVDYSEPKRITVREAYESFAGWDPFKSWDADRFDFDMATKIEPALKSLGAVFLTDYPPQASSLARVCGGIAERWEFYFNGIELANCFSELCDSVEQRRRFDESRKERKELGEDDYPIDEEFFSMLSSIPSASGVALGIDRLAMILLNCKTIEEVRMI